ncbi:MAG: hypothetical protein U5K54_28895 [Cytophagales bacterium]|nr:hypothetical protein [Cytophagales bacterium]
MNTRHYALWLQLLRTFSEQDDYDRAEETFPIFGERKIKSKINQKELYLEKAYYYQVRNNYDYMVRNLTSCRLHYWSAKIEKEEYIL